MKYVISVFEKASRHRTFIKDTLYNVECPSEEEAYVRKAILRLEEICEETCDEIPQQASSSYSLSRARNNARLRYGDEYYNVIAARIIKQVLTCKEKSTDGHYYYCEKTNDPVPKEYLEGYPGVNIVSIQVVDEKAGPNGPEFMYCYTFTKDI